MKDEFLFMNVNIMEEVRKACLKLYLTLSKQCFKVEFKGVSFEDSRVFIFRNLEDNKNIFITLCNIEALYIRYDCCYLIIKEE